MLAVGACLTNRNSNGWVNPISPAAPKSSAYADQPNAANVPIEINVSMVAVPWRRFRQAARWKGQAPQTTTGAVSSNDSGQNLQRNLAIEFGILRQIHLAHSALAEFGDDAVMRQGGIG